MNPITLIRPLLLSLALVATPMAVASTPATGSTAGPSTAAACATAWGSTAEAKGTMTQRPLVNIRAGQHACFDRLVLDFNGRAPGYHVRYVRNVRMDGSGMVVPLRGRAKLQIVALAPAYRPNGSSTYTPANPSELVNVGGFTTFRQVAWAGSFEGYTTVGLGARARLAFRVFTTKTADGVGHLVVDVAHAW